MTPDAVMDPKTARRILFALCLSVAVHAALLALIEARPPAAGAAGDGIVQAWLERAVSDAAIPSATEPASMTAASEQDDDAQVPASAAEPALPRDPTVPGAKEGDRAAAASKPSVSAGIEVPLARDLTYYSVSALDTPPRPLGSADLCYPEGASGEVAYVLLIDEAGSIDQATLVSVKPDGLFTAGALESCRSLKFAPAIRDGRAVRSRVRFVVGPSPP